MIKFIAKFIGTTAFSGYFPVAPGTVGTAVALVVLWFLPEQSTLNLSIAALVLLLVGVWSATVCEKDWGKDPGRVNMDEVVGTIVTIITFPKTWIVYVAAFVAFRIFDIWKPVPVRTLEKVPSGWGIMLDDVAAGVYANLLLQIVFRLIL